MNLQILNIEYWENLNLYRVHTKMYVASTQETLPQGSLLLQQLLKHQVHEVV